MKRKFTFLIAAALMLLTMMATTGTMWGQTRNDVTDELTAASFTATNTTYASFTGVTFTSSAVYAGNTAKNSNGSIQLRSNNNNSGIVTTASGGTAKSITVTWDSSTTNSRTLDVYGKSSAYESASNLYNSTTQGTKLGSIVKGTSTTLSISGDYEYIGLRSNNGAMYISKIDIVWEFNTGSSVAKPTFSPTAGIFTETQNVTISCDTEGATIYYTLDGNDPTTSSSVYSTPLQIPETTTVKAIGVKDGMNNSSVATATYTIVTPFTSIEQIFADATANTSAHQVFITFDNWVITGNNGNNPTTAFLSDRTNGCRIYNNSGIGFAIGDILSGTASCNLSLYYGMAQLNLTSAASGLNIQTGGEVTPIVTTIDALTGIKAGSVVTLQNLTYNGSNLTDGDNSITPYGYMYSASLETDHVYNVTGVFEYGYNSVKRINPRDENDIEEVIITTPTISASNIDIECTATGGEIAYTINNPVDGGSLSATTESDWLNLSNNFESPIAFTCSSNTATEERSATVTLTYSYNAKATVTKNVTVTQAAYEAPNVTWDLSTDQTATATTTEMTWTSNYATMAVAKGSASTNTNNYYPGTSGQNYTSTRFYKNSILTITPVSGYELSSIEFTATTENYATTLKNSTWTNATASVSSTIVTVTPTDGTTAISATIGGTCGFTSVKVYYTESSDPSVATTVTIDASGITNTDVYTSTEAGSLSATVHAGETLIDGASVTWESSNTAAATIDENGVVTLVAAGSTTITASYAGVANQYKPSSTTYELTVINSNAPGTENNPYTVADAMAAIDAQGTINEAYVTGIISQVDSYNSNYKSITYWISDDGATTTQLEVYSGKGLNGADFSSINDVQVGATVVVYGNLKKHNNTTYEFDYNNYLTSYTAPQVTVEAPTFSPAAGTYASAQEVEISCETDGATIYYTLDGTEPTEASTPYNGALNIETTTTVKAIAYKNTANSYVATATYHICSAETPYTVAQALAFNEYPTSTIWVHGIVSTAPTTAPSSGQLKYYISDNGEATNELYIYNGKGLNNNAFTAQDDIQVGDIVTITGIVKDYQGTLEFDSGNYLTSFERPTVATPTFTPGEGEYTEAQSVTIACETAEATIYYTTDGSDPTASSTLYETAIPVATTTTIKAIAIKEGMSNSAVATATYTITIAPTASIEIEPASLSVDADAHEETFTVAYVSVDADLAEIRTCDEGGNDVSYDWFSATFASTTDHNNITCTIAANDGDARTAYFKVYALDDNAEDVYSNLVTINQAAYIAPSQEVVDVLDLEFTGVTGSSYEYWSDMTGNSGATYAGNSAGGNESIQLRSKNSSGIVTTTSGGKVTKVEVTWNENTEDGRTLNIYGSNTAYEATSDLYGDNAGTLIGTIIKGTSTELTISDEYTYIGFRSANNAMYLNEIQITWSTTPAGPSITVTPAEITDIPAAGDVPEHTVTIANMTISSTDEFEFVYCDAEGNILGNEDPKPNWIELAETEYSSTGENTYSMVYTIAANEETTPRTGYFKIGVELATETVYSNIVTVTQLGYVAPVATITMDPDEVLDVPAEGDVPEHTVTIANMTISSTDEFEFVYCDAEGNILGNEDPKPNWIELADAEYTSTGENTYSMVYTVAENEETTPRTGYFKIMVTQQSGTVYSNIVTVTQLGYVPPVVADNYELFSGELVEGDYIIYYNGKAMMDSVVSNRLYYKEVNPSNNVISTGDASIVWHIAPNGDYWTIYSADAVAYAASTNSKNQATLYQGTPDSYDNALWTASGTETYEFENKARAAASTDSDKKWLRNNGNYGFACYATGTGGPLSLFKKVDNSPTISFNGPSANIGTYPTGEEITWDNIIVSQHNLTENISLSAKKGTVTPTSIVADAEPTEVVWSYTPTTAGYTVDTITATSGTVEATFLIQFVAKTPHNINIASVENGTIAVVGGKTTEIEGENVDLTVTPDEGYVIDEITVMAGETPVDYIQGETFYRFQMPDSDVTISATFNALPKYTITFNVNGTPDGSLTIPNIVQGNSTALPTASTLTPAGFSIAGWAEEGSTIAVADPYTPTDNVDLYALFQLDNAQTTSGNYVKVTEELTDWSGEYLIVYEDGNVAFNGNLETFDAVENTVDVVISSSTIVANDDMNNAAFTIAPMTGGGYSIQGTSGKYIGVGSYANGLTTNDDPVANAISIDASGNALITITFTGGDMTLKYNDAENQLRFRYYKSGQKDIQLYKKVSTSFNNVVVLEESQTMSTSIQESTCVVVPNNVTLTYTGPNPSTPEALVVQEGGQLILESDINATVQKSVSGYGSKSGSGWYLISSPVAGLSTSAVATGTYDLFAYDEATAYWWVDHAIPGQTANHTFDTLSRGKGYLYANSTDVNLNYAGTMKATNTNIKVDLSYACDDYPDLKGFNLVGNPFTRNLVHGDMKIGGEVATSYLILNNDEEYEECNLLNGDEIKPGQGFFIQATATDQQLEFNPSSKDMSAIGLISIKAGDENYTDKAYIQFGGGNTLRKMTFGENTMVYVMNNDDDYAAARVEELAGTMPVHFVPIEDGFYTITVETKNIENLNYMHLIDNIKNTEIDLLVEPSYTFKASESDNADRFYLVFDFNNYTGVNENYTNDNFAHQIGDEIFVSGEGTLQVFDVLGRFVTGYNVNGDKRISTAEFNTGVYIFRMVGTEVKTQKIIVR